VVAGAALAEPPDAKEATERLKANVYYLASDTLEGRGISTPGIELAAQHIRAEFKRLGLQSGTLDGSYYQPFKYGRHSTSDPVRTRFVLKGPHGVVSAKLGKDFQPLKFGGSRAFEGPIVFAGYGITTEDGTYDDYKGVDAAGKVVLVLRHGPCQDKAHHPPFPGKVFVKYNTLKAKVENALHHKAEAVLLVNDTRSIPESSKDELLDVDFISADRAADLPCAHISQRLANTLLSDGPLKDLKTAEAEIDKGGIPVSRAIPGWRLEGDYVFATPETLLHNVIGVLEGEGETAKETIIIGAHFDHLGYGQFDSLAPEEQRGRIHPGADDNASGVAVILELARRFAKRRTPLRRRLVFLAFCAEESGRIGSQYYASKDPLYPITDTTAMLNFDMVGRLRNEELGIAGDESAKEFKEMLTSAGNKAHLKLRLGGPEYPGDSDHASFANVGVPILYFCTGSHEDRHAPSDTADKINYEGMAKIVDFCEDVLDRLQVMPRPTFVPPPRPKASTESKQRN
jgi:hypothetical protein